MKKKIFFNSWICLKRLLSSINHKNTLSRTDRVENVLDPLLTTKSLPSHFHRRPFVPFDQNPNHHLSTDNYPYEEVGNLASTDAKTFIGPNVTSYAIAVISILAP